MTKEKLLELMKEERPSQKLLEVIDFRPSKSGIKGVMYDVDVLVEHPFIYETCIKRVHEDMPYPMNPFKQHNHEKIKSNIEINKKIFKDV
jgi:hypothetical protein